MKIKIFIIILFLAVASISTFYAYTKILPKKEAVHQKAQVFFKEGEVRIKRCGETTWQDAVVDMDIQDKDSIATIKDANVEIKFGSKQQNYLRVASDSAVEFKKLAKEGNKEISLKEGKVTALLNNLDPESKFEVRTPQAVCGVSGTGFDVEAQKDTSAVKVYEGEVDVMGIGKLGLPTREKISIPAGKKVELQKYEIPKETSDVSGEEKQAWQEWKEDIDKHLFCVFFVYADENDPMNHYTPSGWVGDYDAIRREESSETPHSGKTCLKFIYTAKTPQGAGWAGVYWQNPVNNWGEVKGGYNLKGAQKLTFWTRGEKGGENINRFGIGGIGGNFPDSATREIGPVSLTNEWKQYTIDLLGLDLSCISGGFYWMTDKTSCPEEGIVFYLDEIKYE